MSIRPLDTADDALKAQRSALSELGADRRLRAALEMSTSVRRLRLAGLRSRYPDATEPELVARFVAEAHGVRLEALE